jgi:uncharacterized protein
MQFLLIFLILFALTVVNAVVPLPGSSVVTPFLTAFMPPKNAIAFATIYFLMSSIILIILYRKYLRKDMIVSLLPASLIGATAGAFLYIYINEIVALCIVLVFVTYFTYKKVTQIQNKSASKTHMPKVAVGAISGFFQGGGFAGGDIRNGYLYAKGLSLQEVRATTAAVGSANFLLATIIRGVNGQLNFSALWLLIPLIPILILGTILGRYLTFKLSIKWQNVFILGVLFLSIAILLFELSSLIRHN